MGEEPNFTATKKPGPLYHTILSASDVAHTDASWK